MKLKNKLAGILILAMLFSCGVKNDVSLEGNVVYKTNDAYYLVYNKTVIKLDNEVYITKNKKVSDYFKNNILSNGEADFLNDLKKYFPHGFNGIVEGEAPKEFIEMPLVTLESNKKIVDAILLSDTLANKNPQLLIEKDDTKDTEETTIEEKVEDVVEVNLKGKKVAILNANGISGYAKNLGEKLKAELGVEYSATNYSKSENYNYVVNHKLNESEIQELLKSSGLKYVKILNDDKLSPESDIVIISGNDSKVNFNVEVISKSGAKDLENILS